MSPARSMSMYVFHRPCPARQYGGGFAEEVRLKYDGELFLLFTALFELLPLACALIDGIRKC